MAIQNLFSFFTDSVLRAPTIGCMLMCFSAGLIGVIVFLRKESLIGEALSHAAYPGVILGVLGAGAFGLDENNELALALTALGGAFLTANLGLGCIRMLETKLKVPGDAALCFVLSSFFGIGLTLASEVQFTYTSLYKQVLTYLYGQAATMTDVHILIYGVLALIVSCVIFSFYKELQITGFDSGYAKSLGLKVEALDALVIFLIILSVIIGIRSVGVVLMSAMLIAPPVAARQFTNRLSGVFILAGIFGGASGFLGNYFSVIVTDSFSGYYPGVKMTLPTGPAIVLTAVFFAGIALLFAPERGLVVRFARIVRFRYTCICENILKALWRMNPEGSGSFDKIANYQEMSPLYLRFLLFRMRRNGWIEKGVDGAFYLTPDGRYRASKIVRFHRLWEVYLAGYLGFGSERVHCNAEEIEHIITPELESELTFLLKDPKRDPHAQPIPPMEEIR